MKVMLSTSKQNTLTSLAVFPTHLTITITSTTLCDQLVLTGKKKSPQIVYLDSKTFIDTFSYSY